MRLSSEASCRAFVFATFTVVLIFVISLLRDYSNHKHSEASNISSFTNGSKDFWPQAMFSIDQYYLDEFIYPDRRDFIYDIVISLYVLFVVSSTVLNFCLGFGIFRSGNNLPERQFFDVIGQLVFCNIVWTACNAAKTIPVTILFTTLPSVQSFKRDVIYSIVQYVQAFANIYSVTLILLLTIYSYFYFIFPEKLQTIKNRFYYIIVFCLLVSLLISSFAAYKQCIFDRHPGREYEKNRVAFSCSKIYNRFTLRKLEYAAYIARLVVFVLPVLFLFRTWYYIRNSSYTMDSSTSNIFTIAAAIFSLYQFPLLLTIVRQLYFADLEFLFYEDRIIETSQLYAFVVTVYVVFRYCRDIKYGFLGKRRSPEDIGSVRYITDWSVTV